MLTVLASSPSRLVLGMNTSRPSGNEKDVMYVVLWQKKADLCWAGRIKSVALHDEGLNLPQGVLGFFDFII